jgi:4-hydroxy-tetrahydrodipicolinate reductase
MSRYRVAQCYTGPVGSAIVRRLENQPRLELVGVLVHHPEKVGKDSGELVGAERNGVVTTDSLDEIIALGPDAIIWSGPTYDIEIFDKILRAGINLYNGIGAFFLEGQPEECQLNEAAMRGGVSLAAGGNIPGLISDVLPLFLSGYSGRIAQLRMWQRNDMSSGPSAGQIASLGIGHPPGEGPHAEYIDAAWLRSIEQSSRMVARGIGARWDGITLESVEYAVADEDFVLPVSGLEISKGTAAGVRWTLVATAGGKEFYRLVNEQSTRLDHGAGWRTSYEEPAWRVEVDGDPPVVSTFGWPPGTDPGKACHDLNAARAINVIPRLVEAPPGAVSILDFPAPTAGDGILEGTHD